MNNEEFIRFCYQTILGRDVNFDDEGYYLKNIRDESDRLNIVFEFLDSDEFKKRVKPLEFVPYGHYYSALPSLADREEFLKSNHMVDSIPGIAIHADKQFDLLQKFKIYHDECPFPDHQNPDFSFYFKNDSFGYSDALTLYSMIREFEPSRIIEVGSGMSSCVMNDTNEIHFNGDINLTFIDPNSDYVESLLGPKVNSSRIISKRVQDVDMSLFSELQKNDILFIDSTHVSKLNSDVNKLFFEIIPILNPGVLIHFHDVFWPFEYPSSWVEECRAWNESYVLRAFLQYNSSFEVLFFSNYLHMFHGSWIEKNLPLYRREIGGNIWIKSIN